MHVAIGAHLVNTYSQSEHLVPTLNTAGDTALVIVECRPSFWLPLVIRNALHTQKNVRLYVFGTKEVLEFVAGTVGGEFTGVEIPCLSGPQEYSLLLLNEGFWNAIQEDVVILFQTDCLFLRPYPGKDSFDFVGAVCGPVKDDEFIINGGFSVRRVAAMLDVLPKMTEEEKNMPEDMAFTRAMRRLGGYVLPTVEQSNAFAIETIGNPDTAIAIHGTDKYYCDTDLLMKCLEKCSQVVV
jgi:hypothetical protein